MRARVRVSVCVFSQPNLVQTKIEEAKTDLDLHNVQIKTGILVSVFMLLTLTSVVLGVLEPVSATR